MTSLGCAQQSLKTLIRKWRNSSIASQGGKAMESAFCSWLHVWSDDFLSGGSFPPPRNSNDDACLYLRMSRNKVLEQR